jgi:hypothetical protein
LDEGINLPAGVKAFHAIGRDDFGIVSIDLLDCEWTYLVGNDEHPHPSTKYAEHVDGIEGLTATIDLYRQSEAGTPSRRED